MLYPQGEYYIAGSNTVSAVLCVSPTSFLYVDTVGILYLMNLNFEILANSTMAGTVAGISLCGSSSAVVNYTATSRYDILYLPSLTKTGVTTSATPSISTGPHQIAANSSTGFAVATNSTASRFNIVNCNNGTVTVYNPTFLSSNSQNVNVVCTKDNNFLLGTSLGNIYEVDSSGTLVAGYSMPRTPNNGTAPTSYGINAIAYSNGQVLASTTRGSIFTITHASSSFISSGEFTGNEVLYPTDQACISFSNVVSGACIVNTPGITNAGAYKPVFSIWFGNNRPKIMDNFFTENIANTIYSSITSDGRYLVTAGSLSSNNAPRVKIFRFLRPFTYDFTSTRIQYPIGVDVSGEILRMRDGGVGNVVIDVDQAISAGVVNLPAAMENNYTELALVPSISGWDVREFMG